MAAQELERTVIEFLVLAESAAERGTAASVPDIVTRDVIGTLDTILRDQMERSLTEDLGSRLKQFMNERLWLVHYAGVESRYGQADDSVEQRLAKFSSETQAIIEEIQHLLNEWAQRAHVPDRELEQTRRKALSVWLPEPSPQGKVNEG